MILIKLKELSERSDKNILEIAEETGLNRNTVTALFHNKVDGIKFETIEKICSTYDIPLAQLIEMKIDEKKSSTQINPYRQEGEAVPFTILTPFYGINSGLGETFQKNLIVYSKKGYGWFYWDFDEMYKWAGQIYHRYSKTNELNALYQEYLATAAKIEKIYLDDTREYFSVLSDRELVAGMNKLLAAYVPFWDTCLFIDSFDAGFDQKEIRRLSVQNNLTADEAVTLTAPEELFIDRERKLALLTIAQGLARKHAGKNDRSKFVKDFVAGSLEIKEYKRHFDFYQSNYAVYRPIKDGEIIAELEKFLATPETIKKEIDELHSFTDTNQAAVVKILRKHGLKTNPLAFFQKVTAWRDSRKKYNLMGIVVLFRIINELERRTGIPASCLAYLAHNEVDSVLKGAITRDTLEYRRDHGVTYITEGRDYKVLFGEEALSIQKELEEKIGAKGSETVITGQVASQGFAKGIVCVVRTVEEFSKFKDGQILVTGMTRPEFVPLMKKAAGIVTNEGGITSHAAIVSRELGKPCIIGTKNATEMLHDGDLVEVRALHGTVRILERAKK